MTSTLHIARPHDGGFPRTFCGRDLSSVSHWASITDVPPYYSAGRDPWPACRACLRALSKTQPGGTPQAGPEPGAREDGSHGSSGIAAPDTAGSHDARRATETRSTSRGCPDAPPMIQTAERGSGSRTEAIPPACDPRRVAELVNSRSPRAVAARMLARHAADCRAGRDLRWTRAQLSALVRQVSA